MDDKRFDDIIKNKAETFQDTGHDPGALTDFRRRMSSLPGQSSWRSNRTAYTVGALALFTLMNLGISWYFNEGRHTALNHEIERLKAERSELFDLQRDLNQLQEDRNQRNLNQLQESKVDTVYIYRDFVSSANSGLTTSVLNSNQTDPLRFAGDGGVSYNDTSPSEYFQQLAGNPEMSEELEAFLKQHNLILRDDQGTLVLIAGNAGVAPVADQAPYDRNQEVDFMAPSYLSGVATYQEPEPYAKPEKIRMPNKMLWALEKHNHKGVDFQFGVEGKYHKSNYDVGKGDKNGGLGVLAEVIFSPAWRLETGLHFGARAYRINDPETQELPENFFDGYPGYDDQQGELNALESDALLIQVPLNLKRFAPLGFNKRWYVSAGLTPQWARSQEFDYKYSLQEPDGPDSEFVSFVGSKQETKGGYYATTANLGLGTEVYLNDKLRWQFGVFYQKGLGTAGIEKRKLESSYGLKTSFWFNPPNTGRK